MTALLLIVLSYLLVIAKEYTPMRKSMLVESVAGLLRAMLVFEHAAGDSPHIVEQVIEHLLVEFAQLFLFLLTAMTYVNALIDAMSSMRCAPDLSPAASPFGRSSGSQGY